MSRDPPHSNPAPFWFGPSPSNRLVFLGLVDRKFHLKKKKTFFLITLEAPPQAIGTNENENQVKLGNEIQRSRLESKNEEIRASYKFKSGAIKNKKTDDARGTATGHGHK